MTETYLVPTIIKYPVDCDHWSSQSFKPVETHTLEFIDLDLASMWSPPRPFLEIYVATPGGWPTGEPLAHSTSFTPSVFFPLMYTRARFKMTACTLYDDGYYCIVAKGVPPFTGSSFVWYYVKDTGAYERGIRCWYDPVTHYWLTCPNDDHVFAEFGRPVAPPIPPIPPPDPPPIPPDPPIEKWLIIQRAQIRTETGENMIAYTNVPCHLWFRWTTVTPRTHPRPVLVRGLVIPGDLDFCFDAYNDIEQEEAGDTLEHHFIVEPWPSCQKRYFYFHGTIHDTPSKSTSPIFSKHPGHYIGSPSMDGEVYRFAGRSTWAEIRNGAGNRAAPSDYVFLRIYISTDTVSGFLQLRRIVILFDTREIPRSAKILNATLHLYVESWVQGLPGNWAFTVVDSNPTSNTDVIPEDYQRFGSIPLTDILPEASHALGEKVTFTFTAGGLKAIKPGGITKLGIREYTYDISNLAPTWQWWKTTRLFFYSVEKGGKYRPRLEVNYE